MSNLLVAVQGVAAKGAGFMSLRRVSRLVLACLILAMLSVGLVSGPAQAVSLTATIPVGDLPKGVAVNAAGTFAYVANSTSGTVSVIDLSNNTVTSTIQVGRAPNAVAVNSAGTFAYVTNGNSRSVSVIDLSTNAVTRSITVGQGPSDIAVNSAGTFAYVTNTDSDSVSVINLSTNTVTATISRGDQSGVFGVAVNPAGTLAYVTEFFNGVVGVIDLSNNTGTVAIQVGRTPLGVAVNPTGTFAYVANSASNSVSVIDLSSNTVASTIAVGGGPTGVAVNSAGTFAYVTLSTANSVAVIDLSSNDVTTTIDVGPNPYGVAVNPAGTFGYATSQNGDSVSVLGLLSVSGSPTDVSAIGGNGSATVSWSEPDNNGGASIDSYTVTSSPGGFTCTSDGSTPSCEVTGLTNGTGYTFTVTAHNSVGSSAASSASSSITPEPTVAGAPTDVSAVAADGSVTVSWTAPVSDGGANIDSYTVTSSPGGFTCTTGDGNTTNCLVTGVTNGTGYTFTVTANNSAGDSAASSASEPVTPIGPATVADAPTGVSAVAGDGSVTVSWTAPVSDGGAGIDSYTVTSSPGGFTCTSDGSTPSCEVTGLTNGTGYTFTVTANNSQGDSAASSASVPVTPTLPISGGGSGGGGSGAGGGSSGGGSGQGAAPTSGGSSTTTTSVVSTLTSVVEPMVSSTEASNVASGVTTCAVVPTTVSAPSGVELLTGAERAKAQVITVKYPVSMIPACAPDVTVFAGVAVAPVVSGLPVRTGFRAGISYVPPTQTRAKSTFLWIGKTRSADDGRSKIPAFKASRTGVYIIRLVTPEDKSYYLKVKVVAVKSAKH